MAVLIARRLQEADGREVAGIDRIEEVVNVVLVVAGIALLADRRNRGRTGVLQVLRGSVVLERLVVRDVVGLVRAGDRARCASGGNRWCRWDW